MIADVLNELKCDEEVSEGKINYGSRCESDLSSIDSLEDTGEDERILKSSLKITKGGLNDSANRKVTFSDSIEFNTGDVGWLEIKPLERVPLYQQILNNANNEVSHAKDNTKQVVYTAEEVLDQLREEALMSRFVEPNTVSYPSSVSVAMEQLSQSKKIERDKLNNDKNNELSQISKDSPFPAVHTNDITKSMQNVDHENPLDQSKTENMYSLKNDIIEDEMSSAGYHVNMDNADHSISSCSISSIQTSTLTTTQYNIVTHRQPSNNYFAPKAESQSEELPSYTSPSYASTDIYTSSRPLATGHSEVISKPSEGNDEMSRTSAILYVPQYPYFPSKEQRYTKQGEYDGRLPVYYDYRLATPISHRSCNTVTTSVITCGSECRTSLTSNTTSTTCTKTNDSEESSSKVSLKYINITACDISTSDNSSKPDDIYKEVERTLGGITFPKPERNTISGKSDPPIMKEKLGLSEMSNKGNVQTNETSNKANVQTNERKLSNGSGIPVRVHQNEPSAVRRGRVIVSADRRKRNHGNMVPRPPVKPKEPSKVERNHKISVDNKSYTPAEERTLPTSNSKSSDKNEPITEQNTHFENSKNIINNLRDNMEGPKNIINNLRDNMEGPKNMINNLRDNIEGNRPKSYHVGQQRGAQKTNSDYFYNKNSDRNVVRQTDGGSNSPRYSAPHSNSVPKSSAPHCNSPPKSYVRSNSLPWEREQSQQKNFSEIPLDKTPTDEEINKLWTNVRECIYTEQTEHAYSDSNYIIDSGSRRKQFHQRTLSASSLNRRPGDGRPPPRMYTNYSPAGINRRYGSHDSLNQQIVSDRLNQQIVSDRLNQQIVSDRFSPNMYNKPPLLPQRATRVIRNSNLGNENKYTIFKGNDNLSNGHRYRYDMPHGKYVDVSNSMASFLVLEELCKKQTLTPRQAEAVFEASNSIQKKIDKEKAGISALSMEERRVMESLEKLNVKLKEKGYKAGVNAKVLSSKPPTGEQRRMYANQ